MRKETFKTMACVIFAGLIMSAAGGRVSAQPAVLAARQPEFPVITLQPEDQMVPAGSNASFSVTATNLTGYQWFKNGNLLAGQTNSSITIANAGVGDVGYYSCNVSLGIEVVPTRAASLMTFTSSIDPQTGVDPVVVFGFPLSGNGQLGSCPGPYAGYINYTKTIAQGWGWAPQTNTTIFYATDTNRTNTKIEYVGAYGDSGCNTNTVTIPPNGPMSPVYRFTIFFTNNVPTNAYSIILDGFNP